MFMAWVWKVGNNTSFAVRPSSHRPMLCGDDGAKFLEHTRGTPMLTNRGDDKLGTMGAGCAAVHDPGIPPVSACVAVGHSGTPDRASSTDSAGRDGATRLSAA